MTLHHNSTHLHTNQEHRQKQQILSTKKANSPFGDTTYITGLQLITDLIPDRHVNSTCTISDFHCSHGMTILCYSWFTSITKAQINKFKRLSSLIIIQFCLNIQVK